MFINKSTFRMCMTSYDIYMQEYEYNIINDNVCINLTLANFVAAEYIIVTHNSDSDHSLLRIDLVTDINYLDFVLILVKHSEI